MTSAAPRRLKPARYMLAAHTHPRFVARHVVYVVLAHLDTRDIELQIGRARAERVAADAQVRLLQAGARPQDIRQAEAQVELRAADMDFQRFEALLQANAGSQKQRDDAKARVDVARELGRRALPSGRRAPGLTTRITDSGHSR